MPTIRQQCPLRPLSSSTGEESHHHTAKLILNTKEAAKIETVNGDSSTKPSPGTADSPRKLDILLHNSYALRMYRAEVRILEEVDEESLGGLLQSLDGMRLPAQLGADVGGEEIERDFAD